jgi:Phage tail lysozyme
LTAGTRRNGNSKVGLSTRSAQDGQHAGGGGPAERYTGRHADPRGKTARKRAGRVVPAAGVAAALVAGAAAYGLIAGSGHPQAAQLSTDLSLPVSLSSATHAGVSVGGVDSAAAAMIAAARTASSAVSSASAKARASQSPKAAAKPTAATSSAPATTAASQAGSTAQSSSSEAAATATPTASATPTSASTTKSSSGGSSAVASDIANGNYVLAVGQYLVDNGYSRAAAAGVASCVDGESGANPESVGSGGGGLIGWTPLGSAQPDANVITGDDAVDMMTQLADILYYNSNEIGQSKVDELNSQTDPVAAADFYSQNFEKPAVTDSDVVPSVAEQVYSELGG